MASTITTDVYKKALRDGESKQIVTNSLLYTTLLFVRPLNFILGKTLAVWTFKGLLPLNYESHLQHSTPDILQSFHDPYRYEFAHCM